MAVVSRIVSAVAVMFPLLDSALAGSIADIEHVVLFMQGKIPAPVPLANISK